MSLVPGFNLEGVIEKDLIDIGENINMIDEKPKKKKVKFNFDNLFPKPKDTKKDMNMGNIYDGEPFDGIF